jgi:hypothetical protein
MHLQIERIEEEHEIFPLEVGEFQCFERTIDDGSCFPGWCRF